MYAWAKCASTLKNELCLFFFALDTVSVLWRKIRDTKFGVYEIIHNFDPRTTFSTLDLHFTSNQHVSLQSLMHFSPDSIIVDPDSTVQSALEKLDAQLKKKARLDIDYNVLENVIMCELIKLVLHPLSSQTIMGKKYKHWIEEEFGAGQVEIGFWGIGSLNTWHGQPDARLRGSSSSSVDVVGVEDEDEGETDAASVILETKRSTKKMSQIIGLSVVSSFTEKKLHPSDNPLVPTILVNCRSVRVILYDCMEDVLLVSDKVNLLDYKGQMLADATLFLWLFLNHR